jgi:ribosome-associated toxin RatA of RatAB toxin-antitoxin module
MRRIARSAIVDCSAAALYALVEDIESYPEFLPWCASAHVRERSAGRTVATLQLKAKGVRESLTTENLNTPERAIEMRLLQGPFRHFFAEWRFTPLGEEAAKVEFTLAYEFSNAIVAKLLEPAFERIADRTVDAFVRRAGARHNEAAR